jgi:hypothetical protein
MPGESTSMMFLRFRSLRTCTKGVWYALQLLAGKSVRANKGRQRDGAQTRTCIAHAWMMHMRAGWGARCRWCPGASSGASCALPTFIVTELMREVPNCRRPEKPRSGSPMSCTCARQHAHIDANYAKGRRRARVMDACFRASTTVLQETMKREQGTWGPSSLPTN